MPSLITIPMKSGIHRCRLNENAYAKEPVAGKPEMLKALAR